MEEEGRSTDFVGDDGKREISECSIILEIYQFSTVTLVLRKERKQTCK